MGVFRIQFFIYSDKPCFAHFGQFENACLTLDIHNSAKVQQKCKTNTGEFKLLIGNPEVFHFGNFLLCCTFLGHLVEQLMASIHGEGLSTLMVYKTSHCDACYLKICKRV